MKMDAFCRLARFFNCLQPVLIKRHYGSIMIPKFPAIILHIPRAAFHQDVVNYWIMGMTGSYCRPNRSTHGKSESQVPDSGLFWLARDCLCAFSSLFTLKTHRGSCKSIWNLIYLNNSSSSSRPFKNITKKLLCMLVNKLMEQVVEAAAGILVPLAPPPQFPRFDGFFRLINGAFSHLLQELP